MLLPHFTESGDLPLGVHGSTLSEVLKRFGDISPKRKILARRLERIYRLASTTGKIARFIVFGSFITSKLEPNDVDVFILMDDSFNISIKW